MMGERHRSSWSGTCRADHMLRAIDRFVDLHGVRAHLAAFYSSTGRPSEQRLCEEVHLNLAYRSFCRLGLDGDAPDHLTFSKNRHDRFCDSDVPRHVFPDRGASLHDGWL